MQAARAVGVLTPRNFSQHCIQLTEMVCCSGGGFSSTFCASRHEKPRLTAKWARSYREPDPASNCGFLGYALPQRLSANCALVTPLYTCLGAQSNRGTSVMAPSGPTTQGNVYACALGTPDGFHIGHAIGTVNLSNCATRKKFQPS